MNPKEKKISPLNQTVVDNHGQVADGGKIKSHLSLYHILDFCRIFKNITRNLVFHLNLKAADLQDLVFTTKLIKLTKALIFVFICTSLHSRSSKSKQCLTNQSTIILR